MYIARTLFGLFFVCFLLLATCNRRTEVQELTSAIISEEAAEGEMTEPPHPLSIEGLRERVFPKLRIELKNAIEADEGLEAWEFTYDSDGNAIYSLLERPAGVAPPPKGWPVIIVAHGDIPPEIFTTSKNYRSITRYYAKGGFLVLKPDYRGHGRSEGISEGPTATTDYSIDIMNLISQIDSVPNADADNVFLFGHSTGGEITLRILTISDAIKGATLWAPVTEKYPENMLYYVRQDSTEKANKLQSAINALFTPDEYNLLSPGNYLDSIDIPILVHHGIRDEDVPFEWSISFREALNEAGVDYTFYEYPGEDHNISGSYYSVMDRDMEFFRSLMSNP